MLVVSRLVFGFVNFGDLVLLLFGFILFLFFLEVVFVLWFLDGRGSQSLVAGFGIERFGCTQSTGVLVDAIVFDIEATAAYGDAAL